MCNGGSRIAFLYLVLVSCGGANHRPSDAATDADVDASTDAATTADGAADDSAVDATSPTDASTIDGSTADASGGAVSCDRRNLTCRVADPVCPVGQVPEIVDHCFGVCVPIDQCQCSDPAACPHEEMYTCHNFRQRCGPYLN